MTTILSDLLINEMIKNNNSNNNKIYLLKKLGIKITILSSKIEYNKSVNRYNKYYYCKISYNNFDFNIGFHDSVFNYYSNKRLNKADVLYSAIVDMQSYISCSNINDFITEFGYDDYKRGLRAYKACERTFENMHKMFTNEELEKLEELLSDF